ncbi:MAG: methyltransferase domain-containing protein [Thermoplasmata archaeon]|nr:methyltransferase domain-containing protein [Thermoplasmata archaeon]
MLLVELSGEHPTLPVAEVRAILERGGYKEIYHNRVYVAEYEGDVSLLSQIAMAHSVNELLFHGDKKELYEFVKGMDFEGSFAIEVVNYDDIDSISLKEAIGEILSKSNEVNLSCPDNIFKIFTHGNFYHLTREIIKINRRAYENRKSRPFGIPVSLHPRLAKTLVNLSRVKKGDIIADPFCGTGSILIEAALAGINVIGIDIKPWIVEGCIENLQYFDIENFEVYREDMREMDINVDAVVTDMPYGRASYISDDMKKLYDEAFKKFSEWTDGYVVVGLGDIEMIEIGEKYMKLIEIHPYRVHKSLTRFFCVFHA